LLCRRFSFSDFGTLVFLLGLGLEKCFSNFFQSVFRQIVLFWYWLRSDWQFAVIPVGRCVSLTALSVLLVCCPPLPLERKVSILQSFNNSSFEL